MTHIYTQKLRKVGNDVGFTIPKSIVEKYDIKIGDPVMITFEVKNGVNKAVVTILR